LAGRHGAQLKPAGIVPQVNACHEHKCPACNILAHCRRAARPNLHIPVSSNSSRAHAACDAGLIPRSVPWQPVARVSDTPIFWCRIAWTSSYVRRRTEWIGINALSARTYCLLHLGRHVHRTTAVLYMHHQHQLQHLHSPHYDQEFELK
jgi:hypothetical protein